MSIRRPWLVTGGLVAALTTVAAAQNLRVVGRVTGDGVATLVGPVGIGTTSPQGRLHVDGATLFGHTDFTPTELPPRHADGSDAAIVTQTTAPDGAGDTRLYVLDDANDRFSIWGDSCAGGSCWSAAAASEVARFVGNGTTLLGLKANVGIGTDDPTDRLTVGGRIQLAGDNASDRALRATGPGGESHNLIGLFPEISPRRIFIAGRALHRRPRVVNGQVTMVWEAEAAQATDAVSIGPSGSEELHADLVNHRVGIGTAAPTARLEVAGDVKASGRFAGGLAPAPGRFYDLEMMQAHASGAALAAMKNHRTWWRVARVPPATPNRTCSDVCWASRRASDGGHGACLGRVAIYFNPGWTPAEPGLTTSMENAIVPDNCGGGSIAGSTDVRGDWCVCY